MNRKLMAVAVAGALSAPGLALAQASSVQIYGTISYGPEMRSASGADPTIGSAATVPVGALTAAGAGASSVRTIATAATLGGNYINAAGAAGSAPVNFSSRTATSGSGSNWGLRGRENLGGGMYAGFQIETAMQADALSAVSGTASGTFLTQRNSGLWLGTSIGEFGSGMWDTPFTMLTNASGVHSQVYGNSSTSAAAAIFGGLSFASTTYSGQPILQTCANAGTTVFIGTSAKGCFASGTTFNRRQGTSVWYQSPDWSGFKVRAQYSTNHADSQSDTTVVAGATNAQTAPNSLKQSLWSIGGTYSAGPLFLGLSYEKHNDLAALALRTWGGAAGTPMVLGSDGAGATIAQFDPKNVTGSSDKGWNANARYTFGGGLSAGIYYEKLNWSWSYGTSVLGVAPAATNVTGLDKSAYRLDVAYQTGPHTMGLMFNKQGNIGGSTIGAGFNGNATGVQSWQLGYGYSFSKRTSGFAYYNQVTNDTNSSSSGIVFNGTTPGPGGDPKYYGLGLRHTF